MTTEVQEKPTLVLDGENHVIDDLSDKAKYLVGQLQDLQQQATQTAARMVFNYRAKIRWRFFYFCWQ